MHVDLDKRRVANALEAVNLPRLDDENVTCAGLKLLSVDGPQAAALSDELDLIVRMTMGAGAIARTSVQEKDGNAYIAVIGTYESVRAAKEWQVVLTNA